MQKDANLVELEKCCRTHILNYFLAKFRFDTAENEPAKNLQNFRKMHFRKMHFRKMHFRKMHFSDPSSGSSRTNLEPLIQNGTMTRNEDEVRHKLLIVSARGVSSSFSCCFFRPHRTYPVSYTHLTLPTTPYV